MISKAKILRTAYVIASLVGLATLCSCAGSSPCDGKKCKIELGFDTGEKIAQRDSIFEKNNPLTATRFNVFVESSMSMDGYVSGNTDFKTILHRLIGQVVADVLENDTSISLYYINSDTLRQKISHQQFTKTLSSGSFSMAGGDRSNSDIIEVISQVVKATPCGEVSMFVSDCVYSPESAADIDKALKKQQTDMLNILKNKAKSDSEFGVLLYRLTSDFRGIYYTKTNAHIECDGERPYFVWFFGNASILANVSESISKIMDATKAQSLIGIPQYSYLPYKAVKSDHAYHYLSRKTKSDSIYTFSFVADMSYLPLSKEYIMDVDNYRCAKDKYYIKKIEECADPHNFKYNYKYTVCVRGGKNSFVTPTLVEISLKSMLAELPQWVSLYDDPHGSDYDKGYDPSKLRTFGLSSLVEGIADFYKSPDYITFKILIN